MTDAENSDDERYANESFENESDTGVPEITEFESDTAENSDEDDDDQERLPSVKANANPLKMQSFSNNYVHINKTDAVPFASSSDEDDEVIVGQTLAEINTPSMLFEQTSITSVSAISLNGEYEGSQEEIVKVEDEEEEELKRIQFMEEKYLQQISSEMREMQIEETENLNENQQLDTDETLEDYEETTESDSEHENEVVVAAEDEPESDYDYENASLEEYHEEITESLCKYEDNSNAENQKDYGKEAIETLDQTKLAQIIQSSLKNLKIASSEDNENRRSSISPSQENNVQTIEASNVIGAQEIALAVANALKSAGFNNLHKSRLPVEQQKTDAQEISNTTNEDNKTNGLEANGNEMVHYEDDFEQEKERQAEKIQNNYQKGNDQEISYDAHFDYHITSKTPTSFNSDDYIFHANFIKTFYRTNSTDKLKAKSHPRKNMSFSNERMREIERHNQILLRKILTQKPTYNLKSKPSQCSLQKLPTQSNTRLTTSALNRKKQQRQIDFDNQLLKTKIEAIALRRRPSIT